LGAAARSRDFGGGSSKSRFLHFSVAVAPASVGMTGDVGSLSLRLRPEFQGMCGGCCTGFGQRTAVEDDAA